MPSDTKVAHPDKALRLVVTFDEGRHTYTDNLGQRYESGTALVKRHKPPFNADEIAERVAARDGLKKFDVLKAWDEKRNAACAHGTRVHEFAEYGFSGHRRGKKHDPLSDIESRRQKAVEAVWLDLVSSKGWQVLGCEVIVFCPVRLVAGSIDLVMRRPDGQIAFLDWKTSKDISDRGYNEETMRQPLQHLQHCNLVHYSLQMSIYWHVAQWAGWIAKDMQPLSYIVHLPEEGGSHMIEGLRLTEEAALCCNWNCNRAIEVAT